MNKMFLVRTDDVTSLCHASDYDNVRNLFKGTVIRDMICFALYGKNYASKKVQLQGIAIEYSHFDTSGLSASELAEITAFFRRNGKRFGLIKEFEENAVV